MKNFIFALISFCIAGQMQAYTEDVFKASKKIDLRAPSVPLINSDTYLSIWSPYDKLTDGNTEHWTAAEHPLIGALRVDGKTYRFMGKDKLALEAIIPMTDSESWEGRYVINRQPNGNWTSIDYDDKDWSLGKAAFGTPDMRRIGIEWKGNNSDIWIRREFSINELDKDARIYLKYSHDDIFELYINGEKIVTTDLSWNNDVLLELTEEMKLKLKQGTNVIAAHCHNTTGGAYVDFGLYKQHSQKCNFENVAIQKDVNVLPTQTYYTFECGPVELDLVFTAPLLLNNLDLVSTPINYISYKVKSSDKKKHDIQLYLETTPQLSVHETNQPTISQKISMNGMTYLKTGTIEQPYTVRKGDGVRIDWEYAYLASNEAPDKNMSIGNYFDMKASFISEGKLLANTQNIESSGLDSMPAMAYTENLGFVDHIGKSGFVMLGYDDIYSIEYMYERRMPYWKHGGKVTIFDAFERAQANYSSLMTQCRAFDIDLMEEAEHIGGKEYAELLALVYRQAITAHKLFTDNDGNVLFFSKENHSNGCINTVDITYPSAPLFLIYNPNLLKGMMTSIFHYSESGRWKKPFPAHDLGTYPVANGMLYGGDMPIEEAGNMVMLTAAISLVEGNADYAAQHWSTLTTWANYLLEHGLDPENQVCTDDFAGHLAHNANLSAKAIMAIAGYGEMARILGYNDVANKFSNAARKMGIEWEKMADDGDHYKLAFDKSGTWSQKYNMVWDKVFEWNIFPSQVAKSEMSFYLKKQHKYGLPLDSREMYTKNDWIMWSACLGTQDDFKAIIHPVYVYANETPSRVPISDWYDTNTAKMMNFKARSVVGGFYMKMLMERIKNNRKQ